MTTNLCKVFDWNLPSSHGLTLFIFESVASIEFRFAVQFGNRYSILIWLLVLYFFIGVKNKLLSFLLRNNGKVLLIEPSILLFFKTLVCYVINISFICTLFILIFSLESFAELLSISTHTIFAKLWILFILKVLITQNVLPCLLSILWPLFAKLITFLTKLWNITFLLFVFSNDCRSPFASWGFSQRALIERHRFVVADLYFKIFPA